jgi:hypothetical protein
VKTWVRWGVWLFAVGGALWVLKVVVITVNHIFDRDPDAMPVPVLYLSAVVGMAIGAPAVGVALARRAPTWVQALAAVAAFLALFFFYTVVDELLKSSFEGVGPDWLHEELGILVTGTAALLVGALAARRLSSPRG